MNLRTLTDDQLHDSTMLASKRVREETITLLKHLSEVERRHLFSKFKCDSLHAYCVDYLKMSEAQAGRKVSASRLLNELPVIEEKLRSGAMTLTSASQANSFFRKEAKAGQKFAHEEKLELIAQLQSQSTRMVEKILLGKSQQPEIHMNESVRQKTELLTEIRILVNEETLRDLNRLKEIHSHKTPNATFAQIIEELAKLGLEKLDPELKAKRALDRKAKSTPAPEYFQPTEKDPNVESRSTLEAVVPPPEQNRSRYIPSAIRHAVWMRDRGRCTFVDFETGACCESRRFVEYDHVISFAKGGTQSIQNLRLRCRAHNIRHAIATYGSRQLAYSAAVTNAD